MNDPLFEPDSRAVWRLWLESNYRQKGGIWLVFRKKASGAINLTYAESVEEALCYGWIDSKPGKIDELRSKLWFAPRKPGTGWSKLNKERIEKLVASNAMHATGLEKIVQAKLDGSWTMLDEVEMLAIPEDLQAALERRPNATTNFEAFPKSVKKGILDWIMRAKRPETRAARIEETATLARENIRANQWPKSPPTY